MPAQEPRIKHVPTNIITGALGVGKTTLIQSLLKNKPANERWAVLVNEFGEIGIDGALLATQSSEQNIFIKEVPGGCMCCTSGLPMQIALNLLLAQAKPDRLLIEPTGLGHPKEVLQTLTEPHYQDVLNVQATLTLIDASKLKNEKWRAHSTFREQMQIADTIILTKSDLHTLDYNADLVAYMQELNISHTPVVTAEYGLIDLCLLSPPSAFNQTPQNTHAHHHKTNVNTAKVMTAPSEGILRVSNQGEGYFSRGWLCSPTHQFDYQACRALFMGLQVERLKAAIITNQGIIGFNISDNECVQTTLDHADDSRIEFICSSEQATNNIAANIEHALALNHV